MTDEEIRYVLTATAPPTDKERQWVSDMADLEIEQAARFREKAWTWFQPSRRK